MLAAAIQDRADVIVTFNLKDFPQDVLDPFGIEAQHPDAFVTHLIDLNAGTVITAVRDQRANLRGRVRTAEELLGTLERQGLPVAVSHLRSFLDLI